jgi:hypothetical protein
MQVLPILMNCFDPECLRWWRCREVEKLEIVGMFPRLALLPVSSRFDRVLPPHLLLNPSDSVPTRKLISSCTPLLSSDAVFPYPIASFSMQTAAAQSNGQLAVHEAEQARLFQCSTCKRSFTRADHLTRHVRARKSCGHAGMREEW